METSKHFIIQTDSQLEWFKEIFQAGLSSYLPLADSSLLSPQASRSIYHTSDLRRCMIYMILQSILRLSTFVFQSPTLVPTSYWHILAAVSYGEQCWPNENEFAELTIPLPPPSAPFRRLVSILHGATHCLYLLSKQHERPGIPPPNLPNRDTDWNNLRSSLISLPQFRRFILTR